MKDTAAQFQKGTKQVEREMWCRKWKTTAMIVALVVVIIVIIVLLAKLI